MATDRQNPRESVGRGAKAPHCALDHGLGGQGAASGVFSEGFQTTGSPQTKASGAFQDHTATGKLESGDDSTDAERVPALHHPVVDALGSDGAATGAGAMEPRPRSRRYRSSLGPSPRPSGDDLSCSRASRAGQDRPWRHATPPPEPARGPPRRGGAILRQASKACAARPITALASSGLVIRTWVMTSPVIGDVAGTPFARECAPRHAKPRQDGEHFVTNQRELDRADAVHDRPGPLKRSLVERWFPRLKRRLGRSGSPRSTFNRYVGLLTNEPALGGSCPLTIRSSTVQRSPQPS